MDSLETTRRLLRTLSDAGAAADIILIARLIELETRATPWAPAHDIVAKACATAEHRALALDLLAKHPMAVRS